MAAEHWDAPTVAPNAFDEAIGEVRRWLTAGRDVVIRGEPGSGRSRALDSVVARTERRSIPVLRLWASGDAPLAALRAHPSVVAERLRPDPGVLAIWLAEELAGRRALLVVDDLDRLDAVSATVLLDALRRSRARMLATAGRDLSRVHASAVAELVAARAPAEVLLRPRGFAAISRLLAEELGAPVDVALASSLTARADGNPKVALAIADAARFSGAIELDGDRWRTIGPLDGLPLAAVAHALLPRLDAGQVAALEVLSCAGPIRREVAEGALELDPAILDELLAVGRLRATPEVLVVTPPALAAALRDRMDPLRRAALIRQAERAWNEAGTALPDPERDLIDDMTQDDWRWAADLAGPAQERDAVEQLRRRRRWQAAPIVPNANDYLSVLLRRRGTAAAAAAVFAGTEVTGSESADDLVTFALDELRWAVWADEDFGDVAERFADRPSLLALIDLLTGARRAGQQGEPVPDLPPGGVLQSWAAVSRGAGLLDAGRASDALEACDRVDAEPAAADYHLDGLRAEAMLLLNRADEVEELSRRELRRALVNLDLLGVRVHACALAEALVVGHDIPGAVQALGTSLRLGPGGPLDTTFYRRTLALGSLLATRSGQYDVAETLLDALDHTPHRFMQAVQSFGVIARAALARATGTGDGDALLWEAGCRYADRGLRTAALICWLSRPGAYDPARLQQIEELMRGADLPALVPALRLHRALAHDDQDALVEILRHRPADFTGLTDAALAALDADHAHDPALRHLRAPADDQGSRWEALSAREQEIAAGVSAGRTNRELADAFHLSVRTVESHVSHILRKLGLSNRAEIERYVAAERH